MKAISTRTLTRKKRVLIVDDQPLLREGLAQLINRQTELVCCGEADGGATAQAAVARLNPDLVILELRLGDADGLELIKSLKARFPRLGVLVLSQYDEPIYAERALRAGALGYVVKQAAAEAILRAIRTVLAGEICVSPRLAAQVLQRLVQAGPKATGGGVDSLTDREPQVFRLTGLGRSSRQIATELNLSFKTVETHRENIKHKLGLHCAADLVRYAAAWLQGRPSTPGRE